MFKIIHRYNSLGQIRKDPDLYFKIQNDRAFVTSGNSLLEVNGNITKRCEVAYEPILFTLGDRYLYLQNSHDLDSSAIYDSETNQLVNTELLKDYCFYSANRFYSFAFNYKQQCSAIFESDTLHKRWEKQGFHYLRGSNSPHIFSRDSKELSLLDLNDGGPVWQFSSLHEYSWTDMWKDKREAEIKNLLGVYKGIVWLTLNSGRLLGISLENGEVEYNIGEPNYSPLGHQLTVEKGFDFGLVTQLDEQQGVLFGLENYYYWEIDLNFPDESFIIYDIEESSKAHNIRASSGGMGFEKEWKRNEIYFGDPDGRRNVLGVFDRDKKEVVWATTFNENEENFPAIKKIALGDNQLYVLDGKLTLNVLQRS